MGLSREFRLPRDVRPLRYELRFDLDLDRWTYTGTETVRILLDHARREVVLHAVDIDVRSAVALVRGESIALTSAVDAEAEAIVLRAVRELGPGEIDLTLEFAGQIRNDLKAIYRSTIGDQRIVATQLAPADARRAFPCFDEPEFKARFALEVTGPADAGAVANMPLASTEVAANGRRRWRFVETPKLSSYLLCFCVGSIEPTEPVTTTAGTPCRVWLPRGFARDGLYARDLHRESLDWLEPYTAIPYPYHKMDGIGLPDFSAGAMENPGAVTYRMSVVAADPARATVSRLKQTFEYVAHEITHMWWGDLVTFAWWDDIWLNEAFATLVGSKCVQARRPQWRLSRDFVFDATRAFELDALASTHAIHAEATTVDEAWQRFDAISYQKGASVLRMLEGYLGEDVFRDGVRGYLRQHYEANATAADFWRALDEASGRDVTRIAKAWITEPGHPLVECRREGDAIVLTQQRFFLDRSRSSDHRWPIPMVLRIDGTDRSVLGDAAELRIEAPRGSWLFPNARGLGFYRFALDDALFDALLPHVRSLEPEERLALVDDQWALVRAGRRPVATFLRVLDALAGESDRVVLGAAYERLRWIESYALGESDRAAFGALAVRLFQPQLDRLGYDPRPDDGEDDRELRAIVINALGLVARDPATVAEASRRVAGHLDGRPLNKDVVLAFANVAAAHGGLELHQRYLAHRKDVSLTDVQEERRFMFALAPFRDEQAIAANVRAILDGTIRDQDVSLLLRELVRVSEGRPAYARAIRERWDRFAPLEGSIRIDVLAALAKCIDLNLLPDNEAFLRARTELDLRESAGRALESLRLDGAAAARIRDELRVALT